ncbi:hypothetical protein AVEN_217604-1 [Araneus ventricosus]|uniref:RNase H type-1 domain-containing protein n=1 Tax=Araneus ventricosus TaxID=182803 RepID=A0A4Y2FH36_ARAVE|nr:hypothetical protein AVEN_217604-1 [Araneus ventricosus]
MLTRKIVPPTVLTSEVILEPPLPSKDPNRLKPAFVAVKKKFLDRLTRATWWQRKLNPGQKEFIFLIKAPTKAKVKSLANEALNQFKSWTVKHIWKFQQINQTTCISTKIETVLAGIRWEVIERILLYGTPEWANNITSRQQRLLNSIQRKFLVNITGVYSTTPTAALQVIEGITPLHIKAQMESILIRRIRVSIVSEPHPPAEVIYTDGSNIEGETGCVFCVIQNNVQIHQWTVKLSPHNPVFQAETLAIKEAINWAISKGISTSIWSDSESALRAISSFKSSNPLIQEIQQALLQNPSRQLNWIKAHVGFLGNGTADNLS